MQSSNRVISNTDEWAELLEKELLENGDSQTIVGILFTKRPDPSDFERVLLNVARTRPRLFKLILDRGVDEKMLYSTVIGGGLTLQQLAANSSQLEILHLLLDPTYVPKATELSLPRNVERRFLQQTIVSGIDIRLLKHLQAYLFSEAEKSDIDSYVMDEVCSIYLQHGQNILKRFEANFELEALLRFYQVSKDLLALQNPNTKVDDIEYVQQVLVPFVDTRFTDLRTKFNNQDIQIHESKLKNNSLSRIASSTEDLALRIVGKIWWTHIIKFPSFLATVYKRFNKNRFSQMNKDGFDTFRSSMGVFIAMLESIEIISALLLSYIAGVDKLHKQLDFSIEVWRDGLNSIESAREKQQKADRHNTLQQKQRANKDKLKKLKQMRTIGDKPTPEVDAKASAEESTPPVSDTQASSIPIKNDSSTSVPAAAPSDKVQLPAAAETRVENRAAVPPERVTRKVQIPKKPAKKSSAQSRSAASVVTMPPIPVQSPIPQLNSSVSLSPVIPKAPGFKPVFKIKLPPVYRDAFAEVKSLGECYLSGSAAAEAVRAHLQARVVRADIHDFDFYVVDVNKAALSKGHFQQSEARASLYRKQRDMQPPIDVTNVDSDMKTFISATDYTFCSILIRSDLVADVNGDVYADVIDVTGKAVADIESNCLRTIKTDSVQTLYHDALSFLRAIKFICDGKQVDKKLLEVLLNWNINDERLKESRALFYKQFNLMKQSGRLSKNFVVLLELVSRGYLVADVVNKNLAQPDTIQACLATPTLQESVGRFMHEYRAKLPLANPHANLLTFFNSINANGFQESDTVFVRRLINEYETMMPEGQLAFSMQLLKDIFPAFTLRFRKWQHEKLDAVLNDLQSNKPVSVTNLKKSHDFMLMLLNFYTLVINKLNVTVPEQYYSAYIRKLNIVRDKIIHYESQRSSVNAAPYSPRMYQQSPHERVSQLRTAYLNFIVNKNLNGLKGVVNRLNEFLLDSKDEQEIYNIHQLAYECHRSISALTKDPESSLHAALAMVHSQHFSEPLAESRRSAHSL